MTDFSPAGVSAARLPLGSAVAAISLLLTGCAAPGGTPEPTRPAPNIIFLLTDDQRADALGAAGNPIIHTPHLDSLARDGVRFSNAYVTTPICSISRASYFSGQYERRHGIHDFRTGFTPAEWANTYPAVLRRAGYWSGFIGKFGVGNEMPEDEFDVWHGFPGQGEYETTAPDGEPIHLTRLMGRQAVEFVENAPASRPYVLSVSFKAPHVQDADPRQFIPDPAHMSLYDGVPIPTPATASPAHLRRLPPFISADTTESRRRWKIRFATPDMYQQSVRNYYRLISGVDEVVGEIRDAVRRRGDEQNTIFVFASDNGFFLGEYGLAGKWYAHEESIRIPMIFYDPRLHSAPGGDVRDEIVLNVDVAPTLLELVGLRIPETMQGRSLLPLLRGRSVPDWRTDFLFEHLFVHSRIPASDGVISPPYKYLRYFDQDPVFEQLIDLGHSADETVNLASDPRYAPVLERLRRRYRELVAELGRPGEHP